MIKLLTPLVLGTVFVVTGLGIARWVLLPDTWGSSLVALAFLPIVIGVLVIRSRSGSESNRSTKISGNLRAALVGAGVALAAALLLSITDALGLTQQHNDGDWRSLAVLLSAAIGVMADLLSARLEHKAEKDFD